MEYHEREEILKLRALGLKKVCGLINENCAGSSQYYNSPLFIIYYGIEFTPCVCYLRVQSHGTGQN